MKGKEILIIHETVLGSWMRDAGSYLLLLGSVGTGVYLESAALQWIGGLMAIVWMIAKPGMEKMTYDIDGARRRLDEIEGHSHDQ